MLLTPKILETVASMTFFFVGLFILVKMFRKYPKVFMVLVLILAIVAYFLPDLYFYLTS